MISRRQQYDRAKGVMTLEEVRDGLQRVSQGTFPDGDEQTQWSIVYFPAALIPDYYFRENYQQQYSIMRRDKGGWLYIHQE